MEEALIKRVMPHSVEAEQSVVGAMLMDKDAITTASEIISGNDFYQSAYGIIFDSMVELFNESKPVDLITLQERLKEKDVPAEVASLEFVKDLVTAVPTSANVKYYAQMFDLLQKRNTGEYVPIKQVVLKPWTGSRRHPRIRERLPESLPGSSTWTTSSRGCSPQIWFWWQPGRLWERPRLSLTSPSIWRLRRIKALRSSVLRCRRSSW